MNLLRQTSESAQPLTGANARVPQRLKYGSWVSEAWTRAERGPWNTVPDGERQHPGGKNTERPWAPAVTTGATSSLGPNSHS
jgi:hypothetical protein